MYDGGTATVLLGVNIYGEKRKAFDESSGAEGAQGDQDVFPLQDAHDVFPPQCAQDMSGLYDACQQSSRRSRPGLEPGAQGWRTDRKGDIIDHLVAAHQWLIADALRPVLAAESDDAQKDMVGALGAMHDWQVRNTLLEVFSEHCSDKCEDGPPWTDDRAGIIYGSYHSVSTGELSAQSSVGQQAGREVESCVKKQADESSSMSIDDIAPRLMSKGQQQGREVDSCVKKQEWNPSSIFIDDVAPPFMSEGKSCAQSAVGQQTGRGVESYDNTQEGESLSMSVGDIAPQFCQRILTLPVLDPKAVSQA